MQVWIQAGYDLINNPMAFALCVLLLLGFIVLYVVQARRDQFDLRWLITDEQTKQPSLHKFGQLVALAISSWGFVYQALNGHLTEWYFTAYMLAWAAAEAANKYLVGRSETPPDPNKDAMPPPPGPNVPQ